MRAQYSHLIEHVEPCQVGVWERASGEAGEDAASSAPERTRGKHKVGHLTCRSAMTEKDDSALGEESVEEEDDRIR